MKDRKTKKTSSALSSVCLALALNAAIPTAFAEDASATPAPAEASESASEATLSIEKFHETLLDVMKKASSTDEAARREVLGPAIEDTFDLPYMAEKTTGRFWTGMTDEDKETLIGVFSRLTIANYAERFNGYSGQKFVTDAEQVLGEDKKIVRTAIVKSDGERIAIYYLMHHTDKGWSVIDIYLAGKVSELATRRSDFYATLRDKGVNGLINVLTEKVAQIEAPTDSQTQ